MTASYALLTGDCEKHLASLDTHSIDAIVTDPPSGISFMGAAWDGDKGGRDHWIAWMTAIMVEGLRVAKPGSHAVVWALPRTSHWTATALENAGWEIRDIVHHVFGSGFPKSRNISKALDAEAGVEREVIGTWKPTGTAKPQTGATRHSGGRFTTASLLNYERDEDAVLPITIPATDAAQQWDGWETALKPATEHWILCRKPIEPGLTIAANVVKWGTGALNIRGSLIPSESSGAARASTQRTHRDQYRITGGSTGSGSTNPQGRWPANFVLTCACDNANAHDDDCPCAEIDRQSGSSRSRRGTPRQGVAGAGWGMTGTGAEYNDQGGASRFFYVAKPSTAEREMGLSGRIYSPGELTHRLENSAGLHSPRAGAGRGSHRRNNHPTLKSISLMRHLCTLVTPPNGLILDMFMGSGSTGCAALSEGFRFLGIERDPHWVEIARQRIRARGIRQHDMF